ncbi:MAG: hypothetical protein PVH38_04180 [Gammaproteobacteria bacterium]|jgi:hypothetical protein
MNGISINAATCQAGWQCSVPAGGRVVLMPLLMALSNRFDGIVVQPPHAALAGCNARV